MTRKEQKHELLLTFLVALEKQVEQKVTENADSSIIHPHVLQAENDLNNSLHMLYLKARKLFEYAGKEKLYHIPGRIAARLRRRKGHKELIPLYG